MTITFIGHGYVGLVTACVFADLGNTVHVIGRSEEKIARLINGDPLIFEPGLAELLKKNLSAGRLHFSTSYETAIPASSVVFIAVGTPPKENGEADLSTVMAVARNVGSHMGKKYTVVSCKSTVPVGTNRKIAETLKKTAPAGAKFDVASCPEFLREGSALSDTFHPDRIIIGSDSQAAIKMLVKLHEPLDGERLIVGLESAELIKYASNSILATKISFANLVSFLCEKFSADVEEVLGGVGLDNRIGSMFLQAGAGYGGSCFPKDVKALISTGTSAGVDMGLLNAVTRINTLARDNFLEKILRHGKGKTIGIWGVAFKPNTDDIREAPSIYIIDQLLKKGYTVRVYDPEAMKNAKLIFKDKITYCDNPYDVVEGVSTLAIVTEWNEFKQINFDKVRKLMEHPIIIDGRNVYDPHAVLEAGFTYISTGRKTPEVTAKRT